MRAPASPWSHRDLKRRCLELRQRLETLELASADELDAYAPNGKENTETGRGAWIYCYAQYSGMMRRLEAQQATIQWEHASAARAKSSAEVPERVTLSSGRDIMCYPLSYHALEFLSSLEEAMVHTGALTARVALLETEDAERLVTTFPMLRSWLVRMWVWVLTNGTSGLPFDESDSELDPPAWTREELTAEDLLAFGRAHRVLHGQRLALIGTMFPTSKGPQRMSLEGFIGAYAHEKGANVVELMRRTSIGRIFAQAASAVEQHEAAKAKSDAEKPSVMEAVA